MYYSKIRSHGERTGSEEVLPAESGGHQGEDEGEAEQTAGHCLGSQQRTVQNNQQKQRYRYDHVYLSLLDFSYDYRNVMQNMLIIGLK